MREQKRKKTMRLSGVCFAGCCLLLLFAGSGCQSAQSENVAAVAPEPEKKSLVPAKLEDVTAKAGIDWAHNPGRGGKKFLPETVGGGGGFLDYDNDGNLDILLVNGGPMPGYKGPTPRHALYRNNGNGTFTDVTEKAGLTTKEYGIGAAVADYDNDGWTDIFLTAVGKTRLLHNNKGRFTDVTTTAGVGVDGFTTAAGWLDYDRDGDVDLFVGRYVEWTPETDLPCGPVNARQYCAPHQYHGAPPVFFRNNGNGTFTDVSKEVSVLGHSTKTLAVAPFDYNGDGWIDLFLANDTEPDVLLINENGQSFTDKALIAGIALGSDSSPTGSMGVDVATPFNDGRTGVAIGMFAGQQLSLFLQQSGGADLLFENQKEQAAVAQPTMAMTTFGLVFTDVNGDGAIDVFALNGHIDEDQALSVGGQRVTYKQKPQLFLNEGNGTFTNATDIAGITDTLIGRGLAVGDYDNDGRPDFLAFENGGPVRLWHNISPTPKHWLGVSLVGSQSPRKGTGAMVTVEGDGWKQTRCATTARSYLSVCDERILFALPDVAKKLTVRWSSGKVTERVNPEENRYITTEEAK